MNYSIIFNFYTEISIFHLNFATQVLVHVYQKTDTACQVQKFSIHATQQGQN